MHGPTCIVRANLTVTPFSLQYLLAKKVPKNIRVRVISFYNTLWTGNAVPSRHGCSAGMTMTVFDLSDLS